MSNLHFSEPVCQEPRRLIGDKISGLDQPLTSSHEMRRKLPRINSVLTPTSDPVSNADDVGGIIGTCGSEGG